MPGRNGDGPYLNDVYLPLSRLLRLSYQSSGGLRETLGAFLSEAIRPTPFIIVVAGSVAVASPRRLRRF